MAVWFCGPPVVGQTAIAQQEYWFDGSPTDRQPIVSGSDIDLSALSPGLHAITVRTQDDQGLWSSPVTQYFIIGTVPQAATAISKTEYWFDGDVSHSSVLGTSVATVDLTALSVGLHSITVRTQDDQGVWSSPVTQYFIVGTVPQAASAISKTEYWFDGDVANHTELGTSVAAIDLTELSIGLHSITVRTQDDTGVWSIPVTQYFVIGTAPQAATAISKTEYWFDGDAANHTELGTSIATIDLTELSLGLHSITVRTQDDTGVWSNPVTQYFVIGTAPQAATTISKTEYWFDGDALNRTDLGTSVATIDLTELSTGLHSITVRTQDDTGVWSIPVTQYFVKMAEELPAATITQCVYWFDDDNEHAVSLPLMAPDGIVEITELGTMESGDHTLTWMVGDSYGRWSQPVTEAFSIVITGIGGVNGEDSQSTNLESNEGWYTLSGQKLPGRPAQTGIYIFNGRKVVVR